MAGWMQRAETRGRQTLRGRPSEPAAQSSYVDYPRALHRYTTCIQQRLILALVLTGDRSFALSGPVAWNSLPVAMRSSDVTEETFRRHLKTFLFNCLDN